MVRKIKLFFRLSAMEKKLFIEAYFLLGLMRVLIQTVSFKRLTKSLNQSNCRTDNIEVTKDQLHAAELIGRTITRASNNTPWRSACLVQALTAQRMMRKRNIPGVFVLGVKKNGTGEGKMDAHAWAQCQDLIITGESGHESFAVLSVFGWNGK